MVKASKKANRLSATIYLVVRSIESQFTSDGFACCWWLWREAWVVSLLCSVSQAKFHDYSTFQAALPTLSPRTIALVSVLDTWKHGHLVGHLLDLALVLPITTWRETLYIKVIPLQLFSREVPDLHFPLFLHPSPMPVLVTAAISFVRISSCISCHVAMWASPIPKPSSGFWRSNVLSSF